VTNLENTQKNIVTNLENTQKNIVTNLENTEKNINNNLSGELKKLQDQITLTNVGFKYYLNEDKNIYVKANTSADGIYAYALYMWSTDPIETALFGCMLGGNLEKYFTTPGIVGYGPVFNSIAAFTNMEISDAIKNNNMSVTDTSLAQAFYDGYYHGLSLQSNEFINNNAYANGLTLEGAYTVVSTKFVSAGINPGYLKNFASAVSAATADDIPYTDASTYITIGKDSIDNTSTLKSYSTGSGHWYNLGIFNGGDFKIEIESKKEEYAFLSVLNTVAALMQNKNVADSAITYPRKHVGCYILVEVDPVGHPDQYLYKGVWENFTKKTFSYIKRTDGENQSHPSTAKKITRTILYTSYGFVITNIDPVTKADVFVAGGLATTVAWTENNESLTTSTYQSKMHSSEFSNLHDYLSFLKNNVGPSFLSLNESMDSTIIDKEGNVAWQSGKLPNLSDAALRKIEGLVFNSVGGNSGDIVLDTYLRKQTGNSRDMAVLGSDADFDLIYNYANALPWKKSPSNALVGVVTDYTQVSNHIYTYAHPTNSRLNSHIETIQSIAHGNINWYSLYGNIVGNVGGIDNVFEKTRLANTEDYRKIMRQWLECGPLTAKGLFNWTAIFTNLGLMSISSTGVVTVVPTSQWANPPTKFTDEKLNNLQYDYQSKVAQIYLPGMINALASAAPVAIPGMPQNFGNGTPGSDVDLSDVTQAEIDDGIAALTEWHAGGNGCSYDLEDKPLLFQVMMMQMKALISVGMTKKYAAIVADNTLTTAESASYESLFNIGAWAVNVWNEISANNMNTPADIIAQNFPNITDNGAGVYTFTDLTETQQMELFRNALLKPSGFESGVLSFFDPLQVGDVPITGETLVNYALVHALHYIKLMNDTITINTIDSSGRPSGLDSSNAATLSLKLRREWKYLHTMVVPFDKVNGTNLLLSVPGHMDAFTGGGLNTYGQWFAAYTLQLGAGGNTVTPIGVSGDLTPFNNEYGNMLGASGAKLFNYSVNTFSLDTTMFLTTNGFPIIGSGDLAFQTFGYDDNGPIRKTEKTWTPNILSRTEKTFTALYRKQNKLPSVNTFDKVPDSEYILNDPSKLL